MPDVFPPAALDYASPTRPPTPSTESYRTAIECGAIAAGGGVSITIGAVIFQHGVFLILGALWLLVGGVLTLVSIGHAVAYGHQARRAGYRPPHTRGEAVVLLVLVSCNVPLASLCMWLGGQCVDGFGV